MNPNTQNTQGQLDPSIVNLAKAIGKTESGGNYDAVGKSGEYGAYQFRPDTWKSWAQTHLGDANAPMTRENQDKVVYKQIESWGKQGYKPSQIASLWNSGKPNWEGNVGINSYGVKYDTPQYVKSVGSVYEQLQTGNQNPVITPNASSVLPEEGLKSELKHRFSDAGTALGDTASGKINPISGVLQTVGAVAGGVGDVVNAGLKLIPGVKQIEGLIGKGASKLANTGVGKSVIGAAHNFAERHPELSNDIKAVGNIVTAIPIFKGLGVVGKAASIGGREALGIAGKTLVKSAEPKMINALEEIVGTTKTGRQLLKESPDLMKTIVDERALPTVENGRYVTADTEEALRKSIDYNGKTLEKELTKVKEPISVNELKARAIKDADTFHENNPDLPDITSKMETYIDHLGKKYGIPVTQDGKVVDYTVDASRLQGYKQGLYRAIDWKSETSKNDALRSAAHSIMQTIEDVAKRNGLQGVAEHNAYTGKLLKALDALKHIEGKPAKVGLVRGLIQKSAGTIAGGAIGKAVGGEAGTIVGSYVGNQASNLLRKRGVGGIINRSAINRSPKTIKSPLRYVPK